MISPTRPSPPPPDRDAAAAAQPPPRPRRSWTLDVSRRRPRDTSSSDDLRGSKKLLSGADIANRTSTAPCTSWRGGVRSRWTWLSSNRAIEAMAPATRSPPPPSPASLTSSSAVSCAPKAAAYCRARCTASRTASSRACSTAGLSGRSRHPGPDTSTSSSRPRSTTRSPTASSRATVSRVCTVATGSPGARRSRTSRWTDDGAGLHRLDRVPGRRDDGGHLRLGGLAALQRRLPVAGAHADGDPDVGELRLDQQDGLAADDDLRFGELGEGAVHGDLRRVRRRDSGRRRGTARARRAGDVLLSGPHERRGVVVAVSNRIRAALTTTVLTTAATGFMAGCAAGGEDEEEQVAYCTDENGEIVDEDLCDDDRVGGGGGLFFLYLGGFRPGLPVGTVLPSGGTRINPTDSVARQRAGLPATGKVSAGQRVSGGIGSGIGNKAGTGAGS